MALRFMDENNSAKRITRKVAVIWGKFGEDTEFALKSVCPKCEEAGKECEVCEEHIYIQQIEKEEKNDIHSK